MDINGMLSSCTQHISIHRIPQALIGSCFEVRNLAIFGRLFRTDIQMPTIHGAFPRVPASAASLPSLKPSHLTANHIS